MSICNFCSHYPNPVYTSMDTTKLLQLGVGIYNVLYKCKTCENLWLENAYEPALYNYFLRWDSTKEKWKELNATLEKYKILSQWADCTIYDYYKSENVPQVFLEYVERHRKRSYFHYNPIDKVEKNKLKKPDLI